MKEGEDQNEGYLMMQQNHRILPLIILHHNPFIGAMRKNLNRIDIAFYGVDNEMNRNLDITINGQNAADLPSIKMVDDDRDIEIIENGAS